MEVTWLGGSKSRKLERVLAKQAGVQAALKSEAEAGARRSRAILAQHRNTGNATISVEHLGNIDYYIVLEDPAAMTIEHGRTEGSSRGPSRGLYVLRRAFSGPKKRGR